MSGLASLAVVAVCRVCGGFTGVSCSGFDNNDYIAEWVARDDRIDAVTVEAARAGAYCTCVRGPEPS